MKFPGSKLLHEWDLSAQALSLDDLQESCRQSGLTGFAELRLPTAAGLIFYYLGGEINVLYREGGVAANGQEALNRLREKVAERAGSVAVHEMPLEVAHLLRGISNRKRLNEPLRDPQDVARLLGGLEKAEHTGTLEIQTPDGSAMILLVRGRVSNTYWEGKDGRTVDKGAARRHLDEALRGDAQALVHLADFSRDVWKSRHEVRVASKSRLERRDDTPLAPVQLASEEMQLRERILEALLQQAPAVVLAVFFDLMTGAVLVRRGPGATGIDVGPLAERVPEIVRELRGRLQGLAGEEPLETFDLSTRKLSVLVAVIGETEEAVAVYADRSQPTELLGAALGRAIHEYELGLRPLANRPPRGARIQSP